MMEKRWIDYINSLDVPYSPFIEEMREEAIANNVPIIRRDAQNVLCTLLQIKQPKTILEVGAAIGYSSIVMSEALDHEVMITTIENYAPRIEEAKKNFIKAKRFNISLLEGDASIHIEELVSQDKKFDFIFMDAAKGQYIKWLPNAIRLLSEGAVLVSDNILQEGDLLESRFAIERRNRTIHNRMREYLYELTHHDALKTIMLPVGDGMTITTLKKGFCL